jgi:predicted transport protein
MAAKNPQDMTVAMTESMQNRTGRTLQEWVNLVLSLDIDPLDQNAVRHWLKTEHGVLQNSQWAIANAAARAAGWHEPTPEEYVDEQYTGPKAALRPIFDRLREIIEGFGEDVRMEGRSTYTPFVRRRQFVAIAAGTRTRMDVGLRYIQAPDSELLVVANAPGQATHKVSLTSVGEISKGVKRLLRIAYDQNK